MNREYISKKQMQLLIFSYCIGAYLLFGLGGKVKQHAWIVTVFGFILSIPILLMYGMILDLYPGKNFYQITQEIFGKVFGKILNIVYILNALFIGAYILNNFVDFIKLTALFYTPKYISMLIIGFLSIWILKVGIESLYAWAHFFIRKILILTVIIWILLIPQMETINLYPIIFFDPKCILRESFLRTIFPFTEIFIFLGFLDYVKSGEKVKNIFIKPLILAAIFVTISTIINLMLIGGENYSFFYYAGYQSVKRLKFQGEFQRIEIMVSIAFSIMRFLEISYCTLNITKGVENLFSLNNYRDILIPVGLLMINFAYIMFESSIEAIEFVDKYWLTYGFFIQILFPLFVFISAFIKKKIIPKHST